MPKNAIKKRMHFYFILTILCVFLIPLFLIVSQTRQTALASTSFSNVVVTAWALNVRESGDSSSRIISVVHRGDILHIVQTKNDWDEITLSNNQSGWVNSRYVTNVKKQTIENTASTVEAIVLNVREKPGLSSQIVGKLKSGTQITVLEEQDGWAKMISSSGVQGWVYEYYISKNAQSIDTNLKIKNTEEPLKGKTIVLDPGHGGKDNGTTSHFTGTHEKTLTLATALVVEQELENAGANVIMTRTTDSFIPLIERAGLSNQNDADAFISIHYNWSNDPSINGVTDFYYQGSKDKILATDILKETTKTTGLQNDGTRFDNLSVLRNNEHPCTLIELGFLSNKTDDMAVERSDYRKKVAQGIYHGLVNYFSDR